MTLDPNELRFAKELRQAFADYAACATGDTVPAADVIEIYSSDTIDQDGKTIVLELWSLRGGRMGLRTYLPGESPKQITYAD